MVADVIAQTFWFFLPAMAANMAPIFAARFGWFNSLNKPLDAGIFWRGKRLFGDNKTIRGFVVGAIFGALVGAVQYLIQTKWHSQAFVLTTQFSGWQIIVLGAWLGVSALLGDAVKSFFKRQFNIAPGKKWIPWDQVDIVISCFALNIFFVPLSAMNFLTALIFIGCGMYFVSAIGVALGIKKSL